MRNIRIVSDSSSDIMSLEQVDFAYAPMKIISAEQAIVGRVSRGIILKMIYFREAPSICAASKYSVGTF